MNYKNNPSGFITEEGYVLSCQCNSDWLVDYGSPLFVEVSGNKYGHCIDCSLTRWTMKIKLTSRGNALCLK